jgi:hypothetical protein
LFIRSNLQDKAKLLIRLDLDAEEGLVVTLLLLLLLLLLVKRVGARLLHRHPVAVGEARSNRDTWVSVSDRS